MFHKAKVKSLKMTALIVAAFVVCWTPYYVVYVYITFSRVNEIKKNFSWLVLFANSNCLLNPLIYGAFHIVKRRKEKRNQRRYVMNTSLIWLNYQPPNKFKLSLSLVLIIFLKFNIYFINRLMTIILFEYFHSKSSIFFFSKYDLF